MLKKQLEEDYEPVTTEEFKQACIKVTAYIKNHLMTLGRSTQHYVVLNLLATDIDLQRRIRAKRVS